MSQVYVEKVLESRRVAVYIDDTHQLHQILLGRIIMVMSDPKEQNILNALNGGLTNNDPITMTDHLLHSYVNTLKYDGHVHVNARGYTLGVSYTNLIEKLRLTDDVSKLVKLFQFFRWVHLRSPGLRRSMTIRVLIEALKSQGKVSICYNKTPGGSSRLVTLRYLTREGYYVQGETKHEFIPTLMHTQFLLTFNGIMKDQYQDTSLCQR